VSWTLSSSSADANDSAPTTPSGLLPRFRRCRQQPHRRALHSALTNSKKKNSVSYYICYIKVSVLLHLLYKSQCPITFAI
jgi:hypothetical protein